ncbi:MAG TPA: HD domain-containing protein [Solirubrobacteraceae bacterium]|nr:HD domain-containing protein [Solirubrobacteraceae bacterium]
MPEFETVFDAVASSRAERESLSRLRVATGSIGGPMERHCLRCRQIAAELAARRGWIVDGEVLTVAAILHDIGLYPEASRGGVYTADGAALARALLPDFGWGAERIELCAEAIDRHHELRPQLARGAEVEALRRADLVDVSGGLVRFGLERAWLQSLRSAVPVTGLAGELAREVGRALRERPLTLPRIFLRG